MSTKLKSSQASLTYPSCLFCGGNSRGGKGSPKKKSVPCQLSLYVNPSESFIVWGKKQDEPKGMVWLRSCCVRRGQEEGAIELISRGCRGRCSYTIKLSTAYMADDWYRCLRLESRRAPTVGEDVSTDEDDRMTATLDAILTEMAPSSISDSLTVESEDTEYAPQLNACVPSVQTPSKKAKTKKLSKKLKSTPVLCNPLQGLVSRKPSCPVAVVGSYSASIYPLESTETGTTNTPSLSLPELAMTRWSWPQTL